MAQGTLIPIQREREREKGRQVNCFYPCLHFDIRITEQMSVQEQQEQKDTGHRHIETHWTLTHVNQSKSSFIRLTQLFPIVF